MNDHRDWIAQLYRSYHIEVERYLIRMLRNASTAEDLLQEAFIRLQRLGPSRVRNPRALLYSVATNLALDYIRRVQNESLVSSGGAATYTPGRNLAPSEIAQRDEALCVLDHALNRLSPLLSEVWSMRWVEERSREEIAQDLKLTPAAIDQRLTRAMVILRRKLAKAGFGELDFE